MTLTREDVISGLRELADWLEANPNVPINILYGSASVVHTNAIGYGAFGGRETMMALARMPGKWRKVSYGPKDSAFRLVRDFGNGAVEYQVYVPRVQVCTKKVVGIKNVEEETVPAHDEEVVEWECSPILVAVKEE